MRTFLVFHQLPRPPDSSQPYSRSTPAVCLQPYSSIPGVIKNLFIPPSLLLSTQTSPREVVKFLLSKIQTFKSQHAPRPIPFFTLRVLLWSRLSLNTGTISSLPSFFIYMVKMLACFAHKGASFLLSSCHHVFPVMLFFQALLKIPIYLNHNSRGLEAELEFLESCRNIA